MLPAVRPIVSAATLAVAAPAAAPATAADAFPADEAAFTAMDCKVWVLFFRK